MNDLVCIQKNYDFEGHFVDYALADTITKEVKFFTAEQVVKILQEGTSIINLKLSAKGNIVDKTTTKKISSVSVTTSVPYESLSLEDCKEIVRRSSELREKEKEERCKELKEHYDKWHKQLQSYQPRIEKLCDLVKYLAKQGYAGYFTDFPRVVYATEPRTFLESLNLDSIEMVHFPENCNIEYAASLYTRNRRICMGFEVPNYTAKIALACSCLDNGISSKFVTNGTSAPYFTDFYNAKTGLYNVEASRYVNFILLFEQYEKLFYKWFHKEFGRGVLNSFKNI